MNKSIIIIIAVLWAFCTMYFLLTRTYGYPYGGVAMAGSWVASALLLVCIVIFVRKHKRK